MKTVDFPLFACYLFCCFNFLFAFLKGYGICVCARKYRPIDKYVRTKFNTIIFSTIIIKQVIENSSTSSKCPYIVLKRKISF